MQPANWGVEDGDVDEQAGRTFHPPGQPPQQPADRLAKIRRVLLPPFSSCPAPPRPAKATVRREVMKRHMGAKAPLFPRKEVLMFSRIFRAVTACVAVSLALALSSGASLAANPKVVVKLKAGEAVIELYPEFAPKHVERFLKLTGEGFYNGIKFHRVIDGFMAQTGDPTGTGSGGSKYPDLPAEFSKTPFKRGTLGAARTADPNSANSQFFICYTDDGCAHLSGQYTVFGQVVSGMEAIDALKKGDEAVGGMVTDPDLMMDVKIAQ